MCNNNWNLLMPMLCNVDIDSIIIYNNTAKPILKYSPLK